MARTLSEQQQTRLMDRYPAIEDLRLRAKKRIPNVAWQYLETGTGLDGASHRNRQALDQISLTPRFIRGKLNVDLSTEFLGKTYGAPFGIAPMGLCGLVWPRTEQHLADTAKQFSIPYTMSTVATVTPEDLSSHIGDNGWFQLYPPRDPEIRQLILQRAKSAGFHTLILTADVPAAARREASRKAGLVMPPRISPRMIWQGATHPRWSLATLANGLPRLRFVESFSPEKDLKSAANFARFGFRGDLDWEYVKAVRELWEGPVLMKGILHPEDARQAIAHGMDGVIVSNHGGRQFDGAPAAIDALPAIVEELAGKGKVVFDSGVRTGLDLLRGYALGADFVLVGRPYLYGVAALGAPGADHVTRILVEDLVNNMKQLGIERVGEARIQ